MSNNFNSIELYFLILVRVKHQVQQVHDQHQHQQQQPQQNPQQQIQQIREQEHLLKITIVKMPKFHELQRKRDFILEKQITRNIM